MNSQHLLLLNFTILIYIILYSEKVFSTAFFNYLEYGNFTKTKDERLQLTLKISFIIFIFIFTYILIFKNQKVGLLNDIAIYTATTCNIAFGILSHLFDLKFKKINDSLNKQDYFIPELILPSIIEVNNYQEDKPQTTEINHKLISIKNESELVGNKTVELLNPLIPFFKDINTMYKVFEELKQAGILDEKMILVNQNKSMFCALLIFLEKKELLINLHQNRAKLVLAAGKIFEINLSRSFYYECKDKIELNGGTNSQKKILKLLSNILSDI